jgi:hypothetical protein
MAVKMEIKNFFNQSINQFLSEGILFFGMELHVWGGGRYFSGHKGFRIMIDKYYFI